ncbi:MAG: type IV pilus modification PilV family protein [Acidobacteriota bacterium]
MAKCNSNRRSSGEAGFTLPEVMVATLLLATAIASVAHLFAMAARSNIAAQRTTFAATLAQEKMEQLRALSWGFDQVGLPIQDYTTNLAVDPPKPTGGTGLSPSPANVLAANVDGYVDYLDRRGTSLGSGTDIPVGTTYVRRWSVEPLPTNPNGTLIFQVLVFSVGDRQEQGDGAVLDTVRDEARLVSVKTRKSR